MSYDSFLKLLLTAAGICLGAYLTALRSKISSVRTKNYLHWGFYIVSVLIFLAALATPFFYKENIFYEEGQFSPDWYAIIIVFSCLVSSILLFHFTKKNLIGKRQYKTSELDPIVNKFTSDADKKNIKLLAGDINFFGNSPREMDNNLQYTCLNKRDLKKFKFYAQNPKQMKRKLDMGRFCMTCLKWN